MVIALIAPRLAAARKLAFASSFALALIGAPVFIGAPALAPKAEAKTLRFAFQGELKAVDPYALMESFSLSVGTAVYEGLIRRGPDLKIEPCLATSWETLDPLHWRFHLRKGVKFHDGEDFTADDVVFSAERLHTQGSDLKNMVRARHQGGEGRRLHGRFHPDASRSASHGSMGGLGHLLEEMV